MKEMKIKIKLKSHKEQFSNQYAASTLAPKESLWDRSLDARPIRYGQAASLPDGRQGLLSLFKRKKCSW
jgi:hypothetical protein